MAVKVRTGQPAGGDAQPHPGQLGPHTSLGGAPGTGGLPSGHLNKGVLMTVEGKVSEFGPPLSPVGQTADGGTDDRPGIALRLPLGREHELLDKPCAVVVIWKGKTYSGVLPVIDWGPALWTGRACDITGAGAKVLGLPSDGSFTDAGAHVYVCQDTATAQAYASGQGKIYSAGLKDNAQGQSIFDPLLKGLDAAGQAVTSPLADLAKAISFIFSLQFLYVIGGGILLVVALYLIAKQSSTGRAAIRHVTP